MKKKLLFIALQAGVLSFKAQTIYSSSFGNLALQSHTAGYFITLYAGVPSGYSLINDGLENNPGSSGNPNRPFHVSSFTTTGWAVLYNQAENDTFLVSTSWLDTTGLSVNRWVITPPISNITANTVLTWRAKSPDAAYRDGYEVYGTNKQGALTPQDFTIGDRLFAIADGSTSGGGENTGWTQRSVALGSFAGQTLRFAFRNNSKDMYQLWIDDIEVVTLPNSLDATVGGSVEKKYILTNTSDSVKVGITALGAATISSITLNYQIGNSSINSQNFSFSPGLVYGQGADLKFALPYAVSQPGCYALKTWIGSVNGQSDQNIFNDTTRCLVTAQNSNPSRTVLFEQFVSAHNGEGPDAQEKALILQANNDMVLVNIHDLDSMKTSGAAALISDYKIDFATAMADRTYFSDAGVIAAGRSYYNAHVAQSKNRVTPASVSIINKSYNNATNQLSFTVKADFIGEVRGDYRLNAYLTENQVGGPVNDMTVNGYNQWNNFYNIPWSPYYQKGSYSSVANTYILNLGQYRHQNVLIHAFNGGYGNSGTIPVNGGTAGQSYQETFTLTLPTPANGVNKFNPDNIYLVGFVSEYSLSKNARRVLNAAREKLTANPEVVGISELEAMAGLSVYPNPSPGILYLGTMGLKDPCSVSVYDLLGRCMQVIDISAGTPVQALNLSSLPDGLYFLRISSENQNFTEKVLIQKGQN
jgi:hypothetical protein